MNDSSAYWSRDRIRKVDDEWDLIQKYKSKNNTVSLNNKLNISRIKGKIAYFDQTLDMSSKKHSVADFVAKLEIKLMIKEAKFYESGLKMIDQMHREVEYDISLFNVETERIHILPGSENLEIT